MLFIKDFLVLGVFLYNNEFLLLMVYELYLFEIRDFIYMNY